MWPLVFVAAEAEPAPEPSQGPNLNQTPEVLGQGSSICDFKESQNTGQASSNKDPATSVLSV